MAYSGGTGTDTFTLGDHDWGHITTSTTTTPPLHYYQYYGKKWSEATSPAHSESEKVDLTKIDLSRLDALCKKFPQAGVSHTKWRVTPEPLGFYSRRVSVTGTYGYDLALILDQDIINYLKQDYCTVHNWSEKKLNNAINNSIENTLFGSAYLRRARPAAFEEASVYFRITPEVVSQIPKGCLDDSVSEALTRMEDLFKKIGFKEMESLDLFTSNTGDTF